MDSSSPSSSHGSQEHGNSPIPTSRQTSSAYSSTSGSFSGTKRKRLDEQPNANLIRDLLHPDNLECPREAATAKDTDKNTSGGDGDDDGEESGSPPRKVGRTAAAKAVKHDNQLDLSSKVNRDATPRFPVLNNRHLPFVPSSTDGRTPSFAGVIFHLRCVWLLREDYVSTPDQPYAWHSVMGPFTFAVLEGSNPRVWAAVLAAPLPKQPQKGPAKDHHQPDCPQLHFRPTIFNLLSPAKRDGTAFVPCMQLLFREQRCNQVTGYIPTNFTDRATAAGTLCSDPSWPYRAAWFEVDCNESPDWERDMQEFNNMLGGNDRNARIPQTKFPHDYRLMVNWLSRHTARKKILVDVKRSRLRELESRWGTDDKASACSEWSCFKWTCPPELYKSLYLRSRGSTQPTSDDAAHTNNPISSLDLVSRDIHHTSVELARQAAINHADTSDRTESLKSFCDQVLQGVEERVESAVQKRLQVEVAKLDEAFSEKVAKLDEATRTAVGGLRGAVATFQCTVKKNQKGLVGALAQVLDMLEESAKEVESIKRGEFVRLGVRQ